MYYKFKLISYKMYIYLPYIFDGPVNLKSVRKCTHFFEFGKAVLRNVHAKKAKVYNKENL